MMRKVPDGTTPAGETPLESWKQIAAYLQRDVRTAKRWEKSEGLPVHRHVHQARSSIYAYPSELDAWRADRKPGTEAPVAHGPIWRRPVPSVAFGLVLLLALVSAGSGSRLGPMGAVAQAADGSGIVTRQVWAGPDVNTLGAPSPDGAYLTFQDKGSLDVAIRDLRTGQKRRLTKHDSAWEFALLSVPSPDGKQVAYTWFNYGSFELRVVGLDGTQPRVLYRHPDVSYLYPGDWSPDSKNILAGVNRKDRSSQIVLVSVPEGSARVLKTSVSGDLGRPRFSPDGRYIAYYSPQQPGSREHDIFLLALDGGRDIPLVQHPANDVAPDWTPDGKRILFGSNRTGTMGAWWIQVADGKPQGTPRLVSPGLEIGTPMGFTRQGSYYYGIGTTMTDVYLAELDLATGKLLAPPSPATQRFVGSNSKPDWSRDGRQLLYLSKRAPGAWGARALCVRSFESGEVRELVSKFNQVSWVRWSPDGRSLLAGALASMYRIDVQTGDVSPVPSSKEKHGWPAVWSRDGKAIFYQRFDAKRSFIVARDLETGQEKELHSLAEPSYYDGGVAVSPDGQQLAFMVGEAESGSKAVTVIKVIPAAGGVPRDLLRGVRPSWRGLEWTPDGLSLLFAQRASSADPKAGLWLIPVRGGQPRKLDLTAEGLREVSIHPDGRHIAFTAVQERSEIWVMENFLPK
jgi:Tol biopolymer transport system component